MYKCQIWKFHNYLVIRGYCWKLATASSMPSLNDSWSLTRGSCTLTNNMQLPFFECLWILTKSKNKYFSSSKVVIIFWDCGPDGELQSISTWSGSISEHGTIMDCPGRLHFYGFSVAQPEYSPCSKDTDRRIEAIEANPSNQHQCREDGE